MRLRLPLQALSASLLLAGCASDYGGRISSDQTSLSPEERRLQQAESKIAELSRRLDTVNLAGMDQENTRLRDDIRAMRGEMERLRYDFDQQQRGTAGQIAALDRRLQRFENPLGVNAPPPASSGGALVSPNGNVIPQPPPPAPPAPGASPPSAQPLTQLPPPPSGPTVSNAPGGPVVTISQGSGASPEEEGAYLAAFDMLKNGKYDDAVKGFKTMLDKWPQGRYADNAWYWMGQASEIKSDYKGALAAYQSLLQKFPTSPKAPEAMLHLGITQQKLKMDAEGRATLQRVIQAYPSSNAAKLAQQRLEPPKTGQ